MQLIYLYIDDIGYNIKNQGIILGNGFITKFDFKSKELIIEKNSKMQISYGDNIKSLDLIVGKNGTGKTYLLNLLASPIGLRDKIYRNNKSFSWFAVYHIKDNYFTLEGQGKVFDEIIKKNKLKNSSFNEIICLLIDYNFETKNIIKALDIQKFEKQNSLNVINNYYAYYRVNTSLDWFFEPNLYNENFLDAYIYKRQYLNNPSLKSIFDYFKNIKMKKNEYINNPKGFITFTLNRPKELSLSIINQNYDDIEKIIKEYSKEIYSRKDIKFIIKKNIHCNRLLKFDKDSLDLNFTNKEAFICMFLEDIVFTLHKKFKKRNNDIAKYYSDKVMNYENRRKYLLDVIINFYKDSFDVIVSDYVNLFIQTIDKVPDKYFIDCDSFEFDIININERWLNDLAVIVYESRNYFKLDNDHIIYKFKYLSSGEAYLIDIYASLYSFLKDIKKNKNTSCILVLDEPDARFHPEWSRNFIKNLTEKLSSGSFKKFDFQIIISTHSPYFVTDVECEHINCLEKIEKNIVIKKAKNGFMSQLGDIFMDDFFVDSIFGAFSEDYVNNLINDLNNIIEKLDKKERIDNSFLKLIEEKIIPIKDGIICNALNSKVSYIKRRLGI